MPQACRTNAPKRFSNFSLIARGAADPPMTTRRNMSSVLGSSPAVSTCCSSMSQTVGTPRAIVTCSSRSSSYTLLPSKPGPGSTSLAPAIAPA